MRSLFEQSNARLEGRGALSGSGRTATPTIRRRSHAPRFGEACVGSRMAREEGERGVIVRDPAPKRLPQNKA